LIEPFFRLSEQTQHLIVRGGAIRITSCHRDCQEQALLLGARKGPFVKED